MDVYQCPECELKFRFGSELDSHIRDEHPDFHAEAKSVEDSLLSASHRHRHKPRPHQDDRQP
jgi:hypothetical protein